MSQAHLLFLNGNCGMALKHLTLFNGVQFTIGRAPQSMIVLTPLFISKHHAVIVHEMGRWLLTDRSLNGITVNPGSHGQREINNETVELHDEDVISFPEGSANYSFRLQQGRECGNEGDQLSHPSTNTGKRRSTVETPIEQKRRSLGMCNEELLVSIRRKESLIKELQKQIQEHEDFRIATELALRDKLRVAAQFEYECCICFSIFVEPASLKCGHSFCMGCILQWIEQMKRTLRGTKQQPGCPVCRKVIRESPKEQEGVGKFLTSLRECQLIE